MSLFKNKIKKVGTVLAIITGALLVISLSIGYYIVYAPIISKKIVLYVPTKASYQQVCDSLRESGFIEDYRFELVAKIKKYPHYIKPGRYVLEKGASTSNVINKLRSGAQDEVRLQFSRVYTIEDMAGTIGTQIETDSAHLMDFFNDEILLSTYTVEGEPITKETVLACFIPNTYFFNWNTSADAMFERMLKEQDKFWTKDRQEQAKQLKMSRTEIITLASIVELETDIKSDKKNIASVYLNRLRMRMPLQADPTVKFAVGDAAIRRVKRVHIKTDSPYNTYMYPGLPPGPICTPSPESIDAVLANKRTSYLFFCAEEDFSGRHAFASNLREHNENAALYHQALNEKNIK